jgi:UDP-glucose 4-epimerase
MKVFLAGGAGYIGTSLTEKLLETGKVDELIVYDNLSRHNYNLFIGAKKLDKRVKFIQGDILDSRNLRKAISQVDAVIHLAAKVTTPFADQDAHLFEQVNHWGTAEVTFAVEESSVQKLIYLSSVSVYGSGESARGLDSNLNPKTFYGISKMRGEEHVNRLSNKVRTNIIRCGNVYGYNRSMRFDAVINKFLFEANFHSKINIHGDGQQHRPFVHINAVCKRLVEVLFGEEPSSTTNLVEHNYCINDIAEVLKDLYPELEMIFINNNIKLRELKVATDEGNTDADLQFLKQRLTDLKAEFTF